MQHINASQAPEAIGAYSHAVKVGKTVYLSGQIGLDPKTMQLSGPDISSQAHQVFKNLQTVCQAAGGELANIAKLNVYLADINDAPLVNEIMQEYFSSPFPARAMLEVARLPKDASIEIDAIMAFEE